LLHNFSTIIFHLKKSERSSVFISILPMRLIDRNFWGENPFFCSWVVKKRDRDRERERERERERKPMYIVVKVLKVYACLSLRKIKLGEIIMFLNRLKA
jgi:hypothetical protein